MERAHQRDLRKPQKPSDDEDDELGNTRQESRSPMLKSARTTSKLGIEMMRTNSRGSVISMNDDGRTAEPESLRKSLEILERGMESLTIPEESIYEPSAVQPRKLERTASNHSHPEPGDQEQRPSSRGHITPPVIFPQKPGQTVTDIEMDCDLTPMPTKPQTDPFTTQEQPTPRANPANSEA